MALGRSRGGLTTKLHLACDRKGVPLSVVVTAGHRHESKLFEAVMDGVHVGRAQGRARSRPERVIADAAYDAGRIRRWLRRRGIRATIKPNPRWKRRRGRPQTFDKATYRQRNVIERMIGHLKEHRRISTRSEKLAENYVAMVKWAFVERYLRILDSSDNA